MANGQYHRQPSQKHHTIKPPKKKKYQVIDSIIPIKYFSVADSCYKTKVFYGLKCVSHKQAEAAMTSTMANLLRFEVC
jgi:hypothetical protein